MEVFIAGQQGSLTLLRSHGILIALWNSISCELTVYLHSSESRPKRDSCEDDAGTLPLSRRMKPSKYYRFCQDLAAIGFGPDRYEDEKLEEWDIQYFKRLSMHIAGGNNESGQHVSCKY
jgi:hypothetical protein